MQYLLRRCGIAGILLFFILPGMYGQEPLSRYLTDDGRIFHRDKFKYDWVTSVTAGRMEQSVANFNLQLFTGAKANLRLTAVAPGVVRIQFWQGTPHFQQTSPMLVKAPGAYSADLVETEKQFRFSSPEAKVTVLITKSPFAISLLDETGRTTFETDTDNSIGDTPITPALGFRRSGNESGSFMSFHLRNQEHTFGFSEKFGHVEKTGTRTTIWSADTLGTNTLDLAYKAIPLLFSDHGWGLMAHSSAKSYWEVGSFSTISGSVLVLEPQLDTFLFTGRDLRQLLFRYTDLTGRPSMPPVWALGIWMSRASYNSRQEVENIVAQARARKFPMDVLHIDGWLLAHYYQQLHVDACDFRWDYKAFPDPKQMFKNLENQGVAVSLWINPYVPEGSPLYEEAKSKKFLAMNENGLPARLEFGEHAAVVDFTNPAATEWWKEHIRELLREGAAVVKADYGDRVAPDAIFANGQTGRSMHNLFPHLYTEAAFQAVRDVKGVGMVWRRPGYIGSQRFPGTWAGDTQPTWEGLKSALRGGLSAGMSGEAFWASDIGGFNGPKPEEELYIRWAQFGMFSGLTRFHGTTPREPWSYSPKAEAIVTRYARLRYRLMPYIVHAAEESTQTGMPIMRHMALEFPGEPNVETLDDQYAFGDDLLVAPVLVKGATERWVYFPKGRWRAFESPSQIYTGPAAIKVPAPLGTLPLFVMEGSQIPMLKEDVQSLKDTSVLRQTVLWSAQRSNHVGHTRKTSVSTGKDHKAQ